MEQIKRFDKNNIRVLIKNNDPYFHAQDICKCLCLSNTSRAISTLSKDDLTKSNAIDSLGREQKVYYISEQGLYDLIFKSTKKEAKVFQKWVTHEVLPSIRKTGKYSIPEKIKQLSIDKRNILTNAWKEHGISKPYEYINLTLQEYKNLGFNKEIRKKEMTKEQLLLLSALESMETLKLFYDKDINGYLDCKESLRKTSKMVEGVK